LSSETLKCQSCGATDITIDGNFYYCNYCRTKHPLPKDYRDKRLITIALISMLLLFIAGGLLYFKKDKTTVTQTESNKSLSSKRFPNMVFDYSQLSRISLFQKTLNGNYLLAGLNGSNMSIYLLSPSGKALW